MTSLIHTMRESKDDMGTHLVRYRVMYSNCSKVLLVSAPLYPAVLFMGTQLLLGVLLLTLLTLVCLLALRSVYISARDADKSRKRSVRNTEANAYRKMRAEGLKGRPYPVYF